VNQPIADGSPIVGDQRAVTQSKSSAGVIPKARTVPDPRDLRAHAPYAQKSPARNPASGRSSRLPAGARTSSRVTAPACRW